MSFIFLMVFKGWGKLVAVISVSTIISYVNGPISAVALRRWKTRVKHPLKIPGLPYIAPVAFVVISLVLYWARWPLTGEVIFIMLLGLPVYFYYHHKNGWKDFREHWVTGIWLVLYLLVMAGVSYIGSRDFGGIGLLNTLESMILVILVALFFYTFGLYSSFRFIKGKIKAAEKEARRKARKKAKAAKKATKKVSKKVAKKKSKKK